MAKKEAPSFLEFMKGKHLDHESHFKTKKDDSKKRKGHNIIKNEETIIIVGILKNVKGEEKPVEGHTCHVK